MDETDRHILKILQQKARIPNVEVARSVGMAPSAVLERIKKLEAKGIIQGYEVRLDPDHFNCAMIAFVTIKVSPVSDIQATANILKQMDRIQEIHFISGEDALFVKMRVFNHSELETILTEQIATISSIKETRTHMVLSTFKESAKIPLPELPTDS